MNQKERHVYEFGAFRLDATEGVLVRGGQPVRLTPKALKLLLVLVQNSGHILDKDDLMNEVWPNVNVEETNLAGNVYALRQALGDGKDEDRYIETIPKRGYRFVARVREVLDETAYPVAELPTSPRVVGEGVNESEGTKASVEANPTGAGERRAKWHQPPKILLVGVILAGLIVAALYYWMSARTKPPEHNATVKSIAVLPLKNLSGDPEQEYFADGMTEAMINELAKIGALRVISRQSVMQYKEARKTTPEIARELKVDAVVDGSVMRSGDRVRITAQLIRAATDEHLWADSYERDLSDVLALQGDIARGIAREIRIKLTPQEQARLTSAGPINPSAHEAYLKGLYYLNEAMNTPRLEEAEQLHRKSFAYFEQATKLEPNYAQAYAGLARSYHWLASSAGFPQFYPKSKEAALKAIAIDDSLAGAHAALAYTIWNHDWDWAGAEREFKRTKELSSSNMGEHGYALFLSAVGRHDEAIREMRLALDIEPLILPAKVNLGWIYLNARRYDQAIEQFQGTLELNADNFEAHSGLGTAYSGKGKHEEAIAEFQKAAVSSRNEPAQKADLGWAYAKAGKRSEAIKILNELKRPSPQKPVSVAKIAVIYAALGEKDQAMTHLERACSERKPLLLWLKVGLEFDSVRSDPRYSDLLRCVGIPQ